MADLSQYDYNPDTVADDDFLFPIAKGNAQAISSELEEMPDNRGTILQFTYEFLDGQFAKRHVRQGFLVRDGRGDQTQWFEISQRQLKKLCGAVGHSGPLRQSDALHFKPFILDVGHYEKSGKTRNKFDYAKIGSTAGVSSGSAPATGPWQQTAAA